MAPLQPALSNDGRPRVGRGAACDRQHIVRSEIRKGSFRGTTYRHVSHSFDNRTVGQDGTKC